MKIGILQLDGKWPNLALMKLAKWHIDKHDDVTILDLSGYKFDRTYGSKIFMGGSGYNIKAKLPPNIEEVVPDYELFNMTKGERIGFTSRGCIRNCEFCIVREKEGNIEEVDLSWMKGALKVILIDNNFLASPLWKEKLEYFIKNKIKVCFSQGLDIRLINKENATLLSKVKFYNHTFRGRTLYFAFDDPKLASIIKKKVKILVDVGIKPYYMLFYVLVGFNTTLNQDLYRVKLLKDLGVRPFIMIYNNRKDDKKLRDLARWVNLNFYKVVEFKDYKPNYKRLTTRKKIGSC